MSGGNSVATPGGEFFVYETADSDIRVEVRFHQGAVWPRRQQMADLFGRDRSVVSRYIHNAFGEGELDPKASRARFAQVQSEGGRTASSQTC